MRSSEMGSGGEKEVTCSQGAGWLRSIRDPVLNEEGEWAAPPLVGPRSSNFPGWEWGSEQTLFEADCREMKGSTCLAALRGWKADRATMLRGQGAPSHLSCWGCLFSALHRLAWTESWGFTQEGRQGLVFALGHLGDPRHYGMAGDASRKLILIPTPPWPLPLPLYSVGLFWGGRGWELSLPLAPGASHFLSCLLL